MALDLSPCVLGSQRVQLEPYDEALRPAVQAALDCDPEAWNLFSASGQGEHFRSWWAASITQMAAGKRIAYAVRDLQSAAVVGTTNFLNIRPAQGCVEIGATFLHPSVRSSHVNPEAKRLMLTHAFASGARRVELVTDLRNVRSQAAIARLGAVREGVLRRDRVTWTGHVRDSVVFSVTDLDWPAVGQRLDALVQAAGTRG